MTKGGVRGGLAPRAEIPPVSAAVRPAAPRAARAAVRRKAAGSAATRWRAWGLLLVLAAFLAPPRAGAESPALDDLSLIYPRGDLFVTATQSARTLDRAPAIATVVTARQIRDMGARNLLDVLAIVPGFGISLSPIHATMYAIEVRGLKTVTSAKVLLLIDGHPVNCLYNGSPTHYFEDFPLEAVRRIEIIRGPGSAVYGANAFVAVINVIMLKPGDFDGTRVALGAGNADRAHQNLVLGHRQGPLSMLAAYDHMETNGTRDFIAQDANGNSGVTNHWRDNHTAYVAAHADGLDLTALLLHNHLGPSVGITNLVDTQSDERLDQAFVRLRHTSGADTFPTEVSVAVDELNSDAAWQVDTPGFADIAEPIYKTRSVTAGLRVRVPPAAGHNVSLGTSYEDSRLFDVRQILDGVDVSATQNHAVPASRQVVALYAQDEWEAAPGRTITAGLRWDHYSDFGGTLNPRLAVVWSAAPQLTAKVLYGRAFRAPSFFELYATPNNPDLAGNPDLNPEAMNTLEGGLTWTPAPPYTISANTFLNRFSKRIVHQAPMAINAGGADIIGTELEMRADWREHRYGYLNWSWQASHDEITHLRLADVPMHQVKAGVTWGLFADAVTATLQGRWQGRQARETGDPRPPTKTATTVDLALSTERLAPGLRVAVSVHNLMDDQAFDPSPTTVPGGYPRPGRTWLVEVGYRY